MTTGTHRRRLVLLLAPLLLGGCGMLTGSSATTAGSAGSAGAASGQTNPGSPWIVVATGSPTPSPTPSSGARPMPYPTATGFLPITGGAAYPTPSATCGPDTVHFSQIKALTAVPGTTSAVVTWYNVGGYNLVEYRLTAISQDLRYGKQRDVGWVRVKPATACGLVSATITGLDRSTGYIFSVDAVVTRRSGDGTHAGTLYRSSVVRTK
ncbi:hypothetical protein [Actinoplanes sp. N902-109]|uniref:hypothetical protein n=1 Tax=Actinoplanes sp. (strain N902-109) TaxID=649831 RepID=UPI000329341B|nr:hypothetical protein [Actinoplanes sp. N902-109]AGL19685.1 hypothetical protein L083_6175 [Actinoplanes sp. N902-109]